MDGWIKLHRKFLDWEWYQDLNTKAVFIHLLFKANYEEKKWHGITIGVGSLVTSIGTLADETGLSVQMVRTVLGHLKSTNEITIKATNKYTLITISNYGLYQGFTDDNQQANQQASQQSINKQITNKQQTTNKQLTTTKEIKKEIKEESKEVKKKEVYGEFGHVTLTDEERDRLFADYGEEKALRAIDFLDKAIEMKGYKYKNCNLAMRKWVFRAMEDEDRKNSRTYGKQQQTDEEFYGSILDFMKGE